MIKVVKKEGESSDKQLKRFSNRVKSRRLMQASRAGRYFVQKPTKRKVRMAAVMRERHRKDNRMKEFLS